MNNCSNILRKKPDSGIHFEEGGFPYIFLQIVGFCLSVCGFCLIQLIFFIAASMGLCFGFVLKSVDNSRMFSLLLGSAYTMSRPFLLVKSRKGLLTTPAVSRLGVHKKLGGEAAGTSNPT